MRKPFLNRFFLEHLPLPVGMVAKKKNEQKRGKETIIGGERRAETLLPRLGPMRLSDLEKVTYNDASEQLRTYTVQVDAAEVASSPKKTTSSNRSKII